MLNLNIYFDKDYWLKHRKLFNKNIYQSGLFNSYYAYFYNRNIPINEKFIKSGPQKLVNNFLLYFRKRADVSFNKQVFDNYYFITFMKKDTLFLIEILKQNKKVIVGPLYTNDDFLVLLDLVNRFENLKIIAASSFAKNALLKFSQNSINEQKIKILPVGVEFKNKINDNGKSKIARKQQCLVYFKGRKDAELEFVLNILSKKNIDWELFDYGNYKNDDLLYASKYSSFGVIIGRTESQGIAINEIISSHLPLFVSNSSENNYEGIVYDGSTVPYWSSECGIKIDNLVDFEDEFDKFLKNLQSNAYEPYKYAAKELSFEAMENKLEKILNTF